MLYFLSILQYLPGLFIILYLGYGQFRGYNFLIISFSIFVMKFLKYFIVFLSFVVSLLVIMILFIKIFLIIIHELRLKLIVFLFFIVNQLIIID